MTPEERVLDAYYDRLQAYAVDKSRVIVVEFQSADPELAARVANSIADGYLVLQQNARQDQARNASQWLSGEIENLRKKVSDAETKAEDFRSKSSLFVGTNNTTLSNQQMGEVNTQLNNARAMKADAEIQGSADPRDAPERQADRSVRGGELRIDAAAVGAAGDAACATRRTVVHASRQPPADQGAEGAARRSRQSDSRRSRQDFALARKRRPHRKRPGRRADGEPRTAQEAGDLDQRPGRPASRARARRPRRSATCSRPISPSIARPTPARSIDTAPTEGRVISRAIVSNTPAYPKKLPIALIATLATLLLSSGVVVTGELLRQTAPRAVAAFIPASVRQEPVRQVRSPRIRSQ